MLAAVIPAKNEAGRIQEVLRQVLRLPVGLVIPVLNGCTDMTGAVVGRLGDRRVRPLQFKEPLGYDVPRIAGARKALEEGALAVLFVDGDLAGRVEGSLADLVNRVRKGADLALCDCYLRTPIPSRNSTAQTVYNARLTLNRTLGQADLGPAIPSHGPAAVSRRLLEAVSPASPGIPPLMQAEAAQRGLRIEVGARIPHLDLGSADRDVEHRRKIAETIIGDCHLACSFAEGRRPDRGGHGGYHEERRFDLLGLAEPNWES